MQLMVIRGAHTACCILVKQLKHIDAALTMMMYTNDNITVLMLLVVIMMMMMTKKVMMTDPCNAGESYEVAGDADE